MKKKATKKKGEAIEVKYNPDLKLTVKEELFCQYLVVNAETRGNQAMSYAHAYGKIEELENASKDDAVYDDVEDDVTGKRTRVKIQESSYTRLYNLCAVNGGRLVRKAHIQRRKYELLNALLRDDVVDGELAKVILQDADYNPKVRAITEYNSLRSRKVEKHEHVHAFSDIAGMTREELAKEKEQLMSFFQKK